MSLTGASADEWVPARPGTEGVLALGLAHVDHARQAAAGRRAGPRGRADRRLGGRACLTTRPRRSPGRPASAAARVERLARELADAAPAVAIIGGAPLAQTNGLFQALAVNALNALSAASAQPGGVSFMPQASVGGHAAGSRRRSVPADRGRRCSRRPQPPVQVLLVDEREPGVRAAGAPGEVARGAPQGAVRRELRQLHRRDERARRSRFCPTTRSSNRGPTRGRSPARRVAVATRGAAGDEAAVRHARDARRPARRGAAAEAAARARAAVADLQRDAAGRVGVAAPRRPTTIGVVERRAEAGRLVASAQPSRTSDSASETARAQQAATREFDGDRGDRTRSTFCRTPRRRSSTGRWRTCRGCRRCPIR